MNREPRRGNLGALDGRAKWTPCVWKDLTRSKIALDHSRLYQNKL